MNSSKTSTFTRYILPVFMIAAAIGCIIYGVFDGEITAVLSKATALCRECVGIG